MAEGAVVTHVARQPEFPDPGPIGRHEPDLLGRTPGGGLVVGEAKTGADLEDDQTREQLRDYSMTVGPDGSRAIFLLAVPVSSVEAAKEAILDAGGELHEGVRVLGI